MHDLVTLNGQWWDWQVDRWDVSEFRLIADNDLTYHHSVAVTFTDVAWVSCADLFHHPVFRSPRIPETEFMRQVATEDEHHVYAWDAETATGIVPMMVVARSARIVEQVVHH
ncbi:hypothetical protein Acy02nite_82430 [Actinoplanes cyaneus]|uniref:Uncharacterized protein n=1 Tax=Actinoplanes cyaneus TaxID=52696 RepID=A0A919IS70_9ACTN|nr:hypothetical protein [Actinoplanes cyaneus]MCW2143504.1 hypothetical protein [Actinoplanes cyaneus]GID70362.1 hypothetical protein Acy02nite_82430 [Actinoplanes cyaneus]